MADTKQQVIGKDISGTVLMTDTVKQLLNQFPGLKAGESISFEHLEKDKGIAFSSDNGSLIYTNRESVTGHVRQTCRYPFYVVYRASNSEKSKQLASSFLTLLGAWISREKIQISGQEYWLESYPVIDGERIIKRITRDNAYGLDPQQSGIQDWLIPITIEYEHEFDQ